MSFERADEVPDGCVCYWRPSGGNGHERLSNAPGCPIHDAAGSKPYPVTTCQAPRCGQPIVWAVTDRGKPMPVDALPHADGDIRLYWSGRDVRATVVRSVRDRFGKRLHFSHFVSCPESRRFRSPR